MRFDVINPVGAIPNQLTESGAPLMASTPLPFSSVMPTATLPDEGSRTSDRNARPEIPEQEEEPEEEARLPEIFHLVLGPDFREILRFLSVQSHDRIFEITQRFQKIREVNSWRLIPEFFARTPEMTESIQRSYDTVLLYHYSRPGHRFKGAM